MNQSAIVENFKPTLSMFIEPTQSYPVTPTKQNPENCGICTGLQSLRKSQTSGLNLSRVKSLQNLSTEREMFSEQSRGSKANDSPLLRSKFGDTPKKLPSNGYFSSLLE
jgi:hypothetical protein